MKVKRKREEILLLLVHYSMQFYYLTVFRECYFNMLIMITILKHHQRTSICLWEHQEEKEQRNYWNILWPAFPTVEQRLWICESTELSEL